MASPGSVSRRRFRQREVLRLLSKGLHNREIAGILGISERSVKACVSDLLLVFGASNRTELAGMLPEAGTATADEPVLTLPRPHG